MRAVNPLVRRLLHTSVVGRRLSLQAVLEFRGRRTGRLLRVPVCVHDVDGVATVFTERPWRHNFTDGAPVVVTQRNIRRSGRAILLDLTPGQVGAALRTALDNGASPFELGLKVDRGYEPTIDDLAAIPRAVIRIDLDENGPPCR
jgi:hypothetical protein